MCGLAFEDLLDQGGLVEVEKKNKKKTEILYNAYNGSNGFYRCPVEKSVRSLMNVPFTLEKSGLEIEFIKEAAKENMVQHKQHKSVGGASIYNAKPLTGVEKSVAFMKDCQASFGALEFVQILARGGGRSNPCREGDFWTAEIDPQTRMDSQMRGDCNFTQLLEEGSIMKTEFMMDSPQDEVHTQQSPHEVQMESITRKTQRGGNFGLGEDCLIVSAWLNTSLDAVQGNEQKHKTYWNRVWEYFNKEKTFTSTRNANSPMNRWSTIQLQTNKFVGILASIEMANTSGVNEQNKIIKAKEAYIKVQVVPLKFDHCWNILRHQPKWLELLVKPQKPQTIRRSTATFSPSTLESIHLGEDEVSHASFVDLERPPGRKAEKEQLNKR